MPSQTWKTAASLSHAYGFTACFCACIHESLSRLLTLTNTHTYQCHTCHRYSSKFWQNIYANAAEQCVISTHTGPLCQFAAGMATSLALADDLMAAGFKKPLGGKVAISSFMGEWGYLLCTKQSVLVASDCSEEEKIEGAGDVVKMCPEVWASHLPEDVHVLDKQALQAFFLIPKYYYKGC